MTIKSTKLDDVSGANDDPAEKQDGIGLSDPKYSSGRRKMLDLVNRLHSTGVQRDMDLPMIAVIGSQSAGKSSLIESISGISLPRASGTCTRVPIECRLSRTNGAWMCIVSLRFTTDARGQPLGQPRTEPFGEPIVDKAMVAERIRRAQRAILDPNLEARQFLEGDDDESTPPELSFSLNCVLLQISGNNVEDLSFVDLPGLIASVGKGGSVGDIDLVQKLVLSYIKKPSCIILLTVACETDFENQGAHNLAKIHDPNGKRTIGVLTKPDRIPGGEEGRWLRFVRNEYEPLENGWFTVKQPDSRALATGISWDDARLSEQEYFSTQTPWADLSVEWRDRLGTANLTNCLSAVLSSLIAKRLPELQNELQSLLQKTEDGLRQLPKPPSDDAFGEVLHLIIDFCRDMSKHLEGLPEESGLLQAIRPLQDKFRKAIRETAPDFRPYKRAERSVSASDGKLAVKVTEDSDEESSSHEADSDDEESTLDESESEANSSLRDARAIYIDEVMDKAANAITRELPDHFPFVVTNNYIASITAQWKIPARNLFDAVQTIVTAYVKQLVVNHFNKFSEGGLQQHVTIILLDYIQERCEATMAKVTWLLELEQRPCTQNNHYYSDYKDKYLTYYRGSRAGKTNRYLHNLLRQHESQEEDGSVTASQALIYKILSGLSELGMEGITAKDLPKLLPPDPYEQALNIMATVRAYFQVAYKRFVDYVPIAIDHELVLGLDQKGALEDVLLKGLGITGPEGRNRCKEFIQEPISVVYRRQELQKRWERLNEAKKELMEIWL